MSQTPILARARSLLRRPAIARDFFSDPVAHVRAHARAQESLRLVSPSGRFLVLRDLESIRRVLVGEADSFRPGRWKQRASRLLGPTLNTLDGAEHRERRALLRPALEPRRVAGFDARVRERAEAMAGGWSAGREIDLREHLDRYSLGAAGEVLLSLDLEAEADELVAALTEVMRAVPRLTPPVAGTPGGRALREAHRLIDGLLERRRREGGAEDDLAAAVLASGLPAETVRGEVLAFLLASVDEPTSGLESAWYLLARHPEAEAGLFAELDTGEGAAYRDAVLNEALRLFPPARHIDRCPVAEVEVGGERVRPGSNIVVSPLVAHHEAGFFARPDEFSPERWLGDTHEHPRGAYLPFGAGTHACIGRPLARSIMAAGLSAVASRWRLRADPGAPAPSPRASRLRVTPEPRG